MCGAIRAGGWPRRFRGVSHELLYLPGGEDQKRLAPLEKLAEQMVELGADRTSLVIAFGGGIVTDMAGFLAAIFMRGIPVLRFPPRCWRRWMPLSAARPESIW